MTPAALCAIANRTLAAALGGVAVFDLWAWLWVGMPGMWLYAAIFIAAACWISRRAERNAP